VTTHRTLASPETVEVLIARLGRLTSSSSRKWGTMTPHEMLCHLSDSFAVVLEERPAVPADTWTSRNVLRFVALHAPLQWPQGIRTRPEVNPKEAGSPPGEFDRDRQKVLEYLRRFAGPDARYGRHPIFGPLTRDECLVWGYRHVDHHLRQFNL
jgi:hypothetical protein